MDNRGAFLRAIRGPLILIALGVLFVLDQSGGIAFTRTWPILLITFGVLKLAERLASPATQVFTPAQRAGSGAVPSSGGVRPGGAQ